MPQDPALVRLFTEALSHQARGDAGAALIAYKRAQRQFPDFADAWANASVLLCNMERLDEALAAAERALGLDPGNKAALYGLAVTHRSLGRTKEAEAGLRGLIEADPCHYQAILALAKIHADERRYAESLRLLDRAVGIEPSRGALLVMRGIMKMWATDLPGAEADFRAAMALGAANDSVRINLAISLLLQGRYREAWPLFGPKMALGTLFEMYDTGNRRWDGGPLHGGALLVRTNFHGFGDVMQFSRFMPLTRMLAGGPVLFSVYEPTLRLARLALGEASGVVQARDEPRVDAVTHILELPVVLNVDSAALPPPTSFPLPDAPPPPEMLRPGIRVGLAWSGNPAHSCDAQRSMGPRDLDALAGVPGIAWYGLQKPPAEDPPRLPGFTDMSRLMGDFLDTALVARHLDAMVTVDTSMLHLAASLGVPTFALLAHFPEWRWGLGGTTPWYPSVRLIRQGAPGDWAGAVERLGAELAAMAQKGAP
jgi:Flp pilus assembly protein TadD